MDRIVRALRAAAVRRLGCGALLAVLAAALPAAAQDDVRQTASGAVRGVADAVSRHFRAIPYARPPIGALRWRPPEPAPSWPGVRDASRFGPACPQTGAGLGVATSEDCLTLNVSVPLAARPGAGLPVLVRIHGGGMVQGSGAREHSADVWNGEGVILVTFNYRLGALGFFAHPLLEAEAKARGEAYLADPALLDMKAALLWVHDNIKAFGGDPGRVTLAGVSAGGEACDLLQLTPGVEGLFNRAIASSGYLSWPLPRLAALRRGQGPDGPPAETRDEAVAAAAAAGAPLVTAADLRALPATALVDAVKGFVLPIIDGRTIRDDPLVLIAQGARIKTPLLTGGNSFEGSVMTGSGVSEEDLLALLGRRAGEVDRVYAADLAISRGLELKRVFGDLRYVLSADLIARRDPHAAPIYLYYNAYVPPTRRPGLPGATHASETLLLERGVLTPGGPASAMRRYWVNFIKTGDPNRPETGLPIWPEAGAAHPLWMVFDDRIEVRPEVIAPRLAVLAAVHDDLEPRAR